MGITIHTIAARTALFTAALAACICGCGQWPDMRAPRVAEISPESGSMGVPARPEIFIRFSEDMERASTEDAVSVTCGESPVPGAFRWRGRTLYYDLHGTLGHGECRITVGRGAEDTGGNNLADEAVSSFFTGNDYTAPAVLSTSPVDGHRGTRAAIVVVFSEAVSQESAARGVGVSPSVVLFREFAADGTVLTLRPYSGFVPGTRYTLRVTREVTDLEGNPLAAEKSVSFLAGDDLAAPCLECADDPGTGVYTVRQGVSSRLDDDNLNSGTMEKDAHLRVVFSEPMDRALAGDAISIAPPVELVSRWEAGGRGVVYSLREGAEFTPGNEYALTVRGSAADLAGNALGRDYTYRFPVNGPLSIPISLNGDSLSQLRADGGEPTGLEEDACIRLDDGHALERNIGGLDERVFVIRAVFRREDGSSPLSGIDAVAAACAFSFESEAYHGVNGSGMTPRIWKTMPVKNSPGSQVDDAVDVYLFKMEAAHYYRLRVRGGRDGVRDGAGNYPRADFTIYFNS